MPEIKRYPEPDSLIDRSGTLARDMRYDNEDPVLLRLAQSPTVEAYHHVQMMPAVRGAWSQLFSILAGAGWEVVAEGKGPEAERNEEVMRAMLASIHSLPTLLEEIHEAFLIGYGVHRVTSSRRIKVDGLEYDAPWFVRSKPPWHFSFTVDRRLIYDGAMGTSESVYNTNPELGRHVDQLGWLLPVVGTDSPYGTGLARWLMQVFMIWRGTLKDVTQGIKRDLGVLTLSGGGRSTISEAPTMRRPEGYTAEEADSARLTIKAIAEELDAIGVIDLPPGIEAEFISPPGAAGRSNGVALLEYLDRQATRVVLGGSTLTTTIDGQGSRAAAETHLKPLVSRCKTLGETMAGWLNEWLHRWMEPQVGEMAPEDKPHLRFLVGHATDLEILKIVQAAGLPIDGAALAREGGIVLDADPGEDLTIRGAPAPAVPPADDEDEDEDDEDEENEGAEEGVDSSEGAS